MARRPDADVHGLLVIDKPAGWTSHDVVARVRRLTARRGRAGKAVGAPGRRVTIHAIDVLDMSLPEVVIDVRCSKGTYVRSLAHDLGQHLGCGAHLTALRRTASGGITIDQALTLEAWE